jgi:hypothetical protein
MTRLYFLILFAYILAVIMVSKVYAVEITPDIGFRQFHTPCGSEYDPNGQYRTQIQNSKARLNDKLFSDNQIGRAIPDFDSVGLNFTFKMD